MILDETKGVQSVFRALSDPTRRDILVFLSQQDMTIGDVVSRFEVTRAAVKKHLNILEEGGLISVHTRGRERINHLEPIGLKSVDEWIHHFHHFWDERLTKLKTAVENETQTKQGKKTT